MYFDLARFQYSRLVLEKEKRSRAMSLYAQQVDTGVTQVQSTEEMSPEERAFQERIDAGDQNRTQGLDA